MIGFFPEPHPDELLFSVCARYAEACGYNTGRSAIYDLLKSKKARLSADLPARLTTLISAMPPGHHLTMNRLVNDHTLIPLFTPFIPARSVGVLRKRMAGAGGGMLHGSLGVNTFAAKVKQFRYCPLCVELDRGTYGETFWHRSHHVPGVAVCATHKTYLQETEVYLRYSRRRKAFVTAEATLSGADLTAVVERDVSLLELEETLANNAGWLLQNPMFAGYQSSHRNHYIHLLYERGYCTYSGVLDRRRLAVDFISYYSSGFLQKLKCEVATDGSEDWLNRFVHCNKRIIHPIYHLLFLQFLGQSVKTFLNAPSREGLRSKRGHKSRKEPQTIPSFVDLPFGSPPWPCLNPVSNHFQQNTVMVCEIVASQLHPRRPRGTFRCACGFAYSRIGPDKTAADRLRLDRYVSFGEQWDNALREGLEKGENYTEIRRRLGVHIKTMLKQMFRLGLKPARGRTLINYPRKGQPRIKKVVDRRRISPSVLKQKRAIKRREFIELRTLSPKLSRTELHATGKALYAWLYKHDRVWLGKNLPEPHERRKEITKSNWSQTDAVLATAVQVEADKIRALPGRPRRITVALVADNLEIDDVWTKRARILPLTGKALSEIEETMDQFAVRRVEWATADFEKQGLSPTAWRIALKAGLRGQTANRPVVKEALERAVDFLKSQLEFAYSKTNAAAG